MVVGSTAVICTLAWITRLPGACGAILGQILEACANSEKNMYQVAVKGSAVRRHHYVQTLTANPVQEMCIRQVVQPPKTKTSHLESQIAATNLLLSNRAWGDEVTSAHALRRVFGSWPNPVTQSCTSTNLWRATWLK